MVNILIAILGQHYAANHEKQHRDAEPQYFRAVNPDGLLYLVDSFDFHYYPPLELVFLLVERRLAPSCSGNLGVFPIQLLNLDQVIGTLSSISVLGRG